MTRIAFIGLGHMGLPMAINLIQAGHEVTGFDLNTEPLRQLTHAGGYRAASVKDLVLNKEVIITMLQTGEQVRRVCLGEDGFYTQAAHALHIDCSSIDVRTTQELHQAAHAHHLLMIDAPVSGGVAGAKQGTLTFMVGGEEQALEKARPYLAVLGKKIIHTGGSGTGQAAKICNNMILGVSMVAVSEAFVLASAIGLSAEKMAEVVNNSSGQCWALTHYAPVPGLLPEAPANHDYQPGFAAAMMLKDLKLSQQTAHHEGLHMKMAEQATEVYRRFVESGFGGLDFSAIIKSVS